MADCTDQETHSALVQTQTPPRKLILLPSLVEQDGLLFSMYIYIYICTVWFPPAGGLRYSHLGSCRWISISLSAGIWTYEPLRV